MLISIKELKEMKEFQSIDEKTLERKIKTIETKIRKVTNNNFQNRLKRIVASSGGNVLNETSPYFKVGDTIEISESINNGLYTIKAIENGKISFEEDIFDSEHNLCTKIEYPLDIIDGALELLDYDVNPNSTKKKVGISSETISRHSVTYKNMDKNNMIEGYPAELFSFCSKYEKARF